MNTARALRYRLLRLFPVAVVKEAFEPTQRTQHQMLEEITTGTPATEINSFCFDNFGFTKQHVFLFDVENIDIDVLDDVDDLLNAEFISKIKEDESVTYNYLFEHTYNIACVDEATGNFQQLQLRFKQPIRLYMTSNMLKISLTILERNPQSYLNGYRVYQAKRIVEDKDIVEGAVVRLTEMFDLPVALDLNKGIKHLWENDFIDAVSVKYKRENSIATEVMDEDMTFKDKYPQRFEEVLTAPLRKHTFRFLQNHDLYCDFEADPTVGVLSFNKYPKQEDQINNVVSKIVEHNQ